MNDQHPLGNPDTPTNGQQPIRPLTFDDILQTARLPEKRAKICLRADLQAEHDELLGELATLVGPDGRLLPQDDDAEASLGESAEARAVELHDRLEAVDAQMRDSMRFIRMRGMSSDEISAFNKQWEPKDRKADRTNYNHRLIAACAVEPELTLEQVQQMSAKVGANAIVTMVETAMAVCYGGGVDVPKSPTISLPPKEQ